ncbi:MAG: GNAT family N-acetyltransferase [Gammaproteobacteria bacterium]|nr:GNAT family N-acetyltransferase [Gammaproteobacteria bacterium]
MQIINKMNSNRKNLQENIDIIKANLGDKNHTDALLCLLDQFAGDPMSGGTKLPEQIRTAVIPGLQNHPTTLIFLARAGSEFIGMAICFRGFSTFYAKPLINVHDLMVTDGFRGKGMGSRLLGAVEGEARQLGCCKVTLEVRDDNESAQGLYGREGFSCAKGDDLTIKYLYLEKQL